MKLWGSVQVYDGRYNEIYAGVWRNATLEYLQSITKKLLGALLFIVEFQLCPNKGMMLRPICKKNSDFFQSI